MLPDTLAAKLDLWKAAAQITREREELFTEVGWLQVLVGQGMMPNAWHPLADAMPAAHVAEFLDILPKLNAREVANMSGHADFIARHCAASQGLAA